MTEEVKEASRLVFDRMFLTQKSEPFDFQNPQMDPMELAHLLVKEMVDNNGLGLSAIQIGYPLRVFAVATRPKAIVLFNPIVVDSSTEAHTEVEGCLSFPKLLVKVKRPFEVRVRFKQPNQEVRTEKWGGLTARIVQHELDHLDGILFFNRANKFHRDQAFRKQEQWNRTVRSTK